MASKTSKEYQQDNIVYGTDPDNVLPRLEIDEFVADDEDTLNLFLLALSVLQRPNANPVWAKDLPEVPSYAKFDQNDQWTFEKVAAVHGWPTQTPWCGVDAEVAKKALLAADKNAQVMDKLDELRGYCTHASNIFPSWHRPYMAAYEQMIYNKMHDIANAYPTDSLKNKYIKAAKKFRFPYWDPAMPRNKDDPNEKKPEEDQKEGKKENDRWFGQFSVPTIITAAKVNVSPPDGPGKQAELPNPLYSFRFNGQPAPVDVSPDDVPILIHPLDTLRSATTVAFTDDRYSDVNELNRKLQEQISTIARGMHRLYAVNREWRDFSNHARNKGGAGGDSSNPMLTVESWHDNVHNFVGGTGHLSDPQVAAYDPIFWLHHCNIDRLIAIYQTQQPDEWVDESPHFEQTLVYGRGLKVTAKTPLLPFYKAKDQFWTSEDAADWGKFGYTYRNTHYSADKTKDPAQKKAIEAYVDSKYTWITEYREAPKDLGFPVDLTKVSALSEAARKGVSRSLTDKMKPNGFDDKEVYFEGTKRADGTVLTWDAGIRVPKFLLQGSFNIWVFIGKPDETPVDDDPQLPGPYPRWLKGRDWRMGGFSGVFVNSGVQDGSCANCVKQQADEVTYEDVLPIFVPLRRYLKAYDDDKPGPPKELRTLNTLEPEEVIPFLKENLHVRLDNLRGQVIEMNDSIRNALEIRITSQPYKPRTPEHPLGVYGESTYHPGIDYKTA